jgi:hypothetical protein
MRPPFAVGQIICPVPINCKYVSLFKEQILDGEVLICHVTCSKATSYLVYTQAPWTPACANVMTITGKKLH